MTTPITHQVLLVNPPSSRGAALRRLGDLTERAWRDTGAKVTVVEAPDSLPRRLIAAAPGIGSAESSWLTRIVRRENPLDIVHVLDPQDAAAAVHLPGNPRVFITVHDLPTLHPDDDVRHRHGRSRIAGMLRALGEADVVLATSNYVANAVGTALGRKVSVLHPPTDPSAASHAPRNDMFRPPAWPYLLTVSDADPEEGRAESIHAWAQLRRTPHLDGLSLVVIGEPLTSAEEAQVTACGGHASVFTDIGNLQRGALHSRARAVLALGQPRSLPMTVLDAHQAGRPVLATDHELFLEAGGQGCVYLPVEGVSRFDSHTWNSIAEDLTSPVVADRADLNADEFSWQAYVDGLDALAREDAEGTGGDTTLGQVDLRRLDELLESSPWAAPPLSLAQLSRPIPRAAWAMPPEFEELDINESVEGLDLESSMPVTTDSGNLPKTRRPSFRGRSLQLPGAAPHRPSPQHSHEAIAATRQDPTAENHLVVGLNEDVDLNAADRWLVPTQDRSALPDLGFHDDRR